MNAISKMRKALGLKGKSYHPGRGYYECYIPDDVTWEELYDRVQKACKKLEVIEYKEELLNGEVHLVNVKIKKSHKEDWYNGFVFSKGKWYQGYSCYMCF